MKKNLRFTFLLYLLPYIRAHFYIPPTGEWHYESLTSCSRIQPVEILSTWLVGQNFPSHYTCPQPLPQYTQGRLNSHTNLVMIHRSGSDKWATYVHNYEYDQLISDLHYI